MMRVPITDPMVRYVHERVVRWREWRENHSLNSAIDDVHRIIKRAAKPTGIDHTHFLSALADKFLDSPADSEGDDEFADDTGVENSPDDERSLLAVESNADRSTTTGMRSASPGPSPSPVDRYPKTGTPRFLAEHASEHPSTGGLLLNVSRRERTNARVGRG